jgi:prepilin-type N-terminal cleavage/methylation domain-containing protein
MRAFTLIELLIVIGIIVILMGAILVAVNPFRQFAQANNASRWSGVNAILNAVSQKIVDNKGSFGSYDTGDWATSNCPATGDNIPTSSATVIGSGAGEYDLCTALVATYIAALPVDPQNGSWTSCSSYSTGYTIQCDPTTSRITVCAPNAQLGETICVSR